MGDALPPDPYLALGVAKDATAAAIKTQYRKLVLKFHPDKVQDESQKQAAADQFHKIQTAYEIVSDEARRARYDAQYKLAELRKDVMERDRGGRRHSSDDDRSPRYTSQPEPAREYTRDRGARVSPQYATEERRPSYAPQQDYFEPPPRSTARKDAEYERSSRRTPPREEKVKSSKASSVGGKKKDERSSRKEKSRKSDRDVRQDRQHKFATATVEEESSSDSDPYERRQRQMRQEDDARRAATAAARDQYHEQARRQQEEADQGYFGDARTQKLFSQTSDARDYIGRSGRTPRTEEPERRPSPVRMSSSRDRTEQVRPSVARMSSSRDGVRDGVEYVKRDGRPVMYRTGSGQVHSTKPSSERRRREPEILEEPARDAKRPPTLNHTKSTPPVIQSDTRPHSEKQRSQSVQYDADEPPIPKMRRAETLPYPKYKESAPEKGSRLRHSAYPTPDTSPERTSRKANYGPTQAYADDVEYASPDGYEVPASSSRYETEERKPQRTTSHKRDKYAEEPTVAKDSRDRQRSSSTKHTAQPPLPRSTSYVYRDGQTQEAYSGRPAVSRENSSRLYGEIPTTSRSPAQSRSRHSPPLAEAGHTRNFSQEPLNMQSGFKTKERPGMYPRREASSRQAAW